MLLKLYSSLQFLRSESLLCALAPMSPSLDSVPLLPLQVAWWMQSQILKSVYLDPTLSGWRLDMSHRCGKNERGRPLIWGDVWTATWMTWENGPTTYLQEESLGHEDEWRGRFSKDHFRLQEGPGGDSRVGDPEKEKVDGQRANPASLQTHASHAAAKTAERGANRNASTVRGAGVDLGSSSHAVDRASRQILKILIV